jgi:hypothetical protein
VTGFQPPDMAAMKMLSKLEKAATKETLAKMTQRRN